MKAWLVTWEWSGEHARRPDKVAGIFSGRLGGARVRELVEFIYSQEYSLAERLSLAGGKPNPYPATFGAINGKPWSGEVFCGHNPFLWARLVNDITVDRGGAGEETVTWKERAEPVIDAANAR